MKLTKLSIIVLVGLLGHLAFAQDVPTPATVPTTARARREAVIPQGFNKVEVEGRIALVEAADEQLVRERLGAMKPTSRPSTVTEMLNRVKQRRDQLVKDCAADLAIPVEAVATAYDTYVITPIQ
jgi:hypothetical protein